MVTSLFGEQATPESDGPAELPRSYDRVLVIAAHPDDAEFTFGGTISRLVESGSEVRYVVCTTGSQGSEDPGIPAADVALRRTREQRAAAALLGVTSVEFLDFEDGELRVDRSLRLELSRKIRQHRPDLVLSHQPLRSLEFPIGASHPDHLAVGEAAMCAVYPDARNPRAFPELLEVGLDAHSVAEIWVPGYERANFFVALEQAHADLKLDAILRHQSQFENSHSPREAIGWVAQRMERCGPLAGAAWAEAFCRIVCETSAGPGTSGD